MRHWLPAFLFWLFLATECAAAPVHVRNFDVLVDVEKNGNIVVSESLSVDIPAEGTFHGIFRDIPLGSRRPGQRAAAVDVLAVRLDGRNLAVDDIRRERGLLRVYQRDREKTLSPGRHEFFLSYRMTGQTWLFKNNDELTWNVTGPGWEAPIDSAACTVLCPVGAPFFGQTAWLGKPGSHESPVAMTYAIKNDRLVMRFEAQRPVQPGEDFTVAAGWQKGFVVVENGQGLFSGVVLFAVLDALLLLYFLIVWFMTGRDLEKGVIVPLFHPPLVRTGKKGEAREKELSAAAAAYVFQKMHMTAACFGAAVISLAGRGCCIIEGSASEGFSLKKGKGRSPHAEENRILDLMEEGETISCSDGERLYAMRSALKDQLRRDYGGMWKGTGGLFGSVWMFLGLAATLLGLAAVTAFVTGGALPEQFPALLMILFFFFFFFRKGLQGSASLFRSGRRGAFVFSLIFQAAVLGFMGFFLFSAFRDDLAVLSNAELCLALLALFIPCGFSLIMDAPSGEGRDMLDAIEGLALYIRMAESPTLNALNPPQRTLAHYREILPYAVALGLEQAWGAHFAAALSAAASSGAREITPALAGSLASEADRSMASHASSHSSSSSSFDGGGGGAGSGGGGGGGGGC